MSCKRLPQRERKTNLQAAKYWTRNYATGMLNQNLYFSCVNGESYYKKAVEESGGRWVFMQVCFAVWSVWSWVSFLVTPIPKRLRGENTASGCPCPPLSFSHYFYRARFLLCSRWCLTFPHPHPFLSISICLCCFLRSEHCCGTGLPPRNKAEFSIHISASVPPSYFSTSLLQLSSPASVLSFFYPLHSHRQFNPSPPLPSTPLFSHSQVYLSFLLLMAARVGNQTAKCPPCRHYIHKAHRRPK